MSQNESDYDKTRPHYILCEGAVVGHYRIRERIGSGGMGEVFSAEDTKLKRLVALKFLPPHFASDDAFRARFLREARAATALDHPNIVTVYEVSEHRGRPFIAMEYADGKSLRQLIDEGGLIPDTAIEIMTGVCEGLLGAHRAGLVHRDVKPGNIIVDNKLHAKIFDFGLAKIEGEGQITSVGTVLGTADYMSPEQGEGRDVDHRSDIFSLGVLFYEMITGRCPFKRSNLSATIHAIVHDPFEPITAFRKDLPDGLQQIVDIMLVKDRAARYQSVKDLLDDLYQVRRGGQARHATALATALVKPDIQSLAVLYLRNLGSAEDEFLSYGITEDLIIDLSRIGSLRVVPMRTVLAYKDSADELPLIASRLNTTLVLDGSIHRTGEVVRVSAQLVDVTRDSNLWAERWEEPIENLPQIKRSLAEGIGRIMAIEPSVVVEAQVGSPESSDPRAYEHYLRGKYSFDHRVDKGDVEVALGLYRKALELEPSLLAARSGIAEALLQQGRHSRAIKELGSALDDARARSLKADEAGILKSLARAHFTQSHWDEAFDLARKSMNLAAEIGDVAGEAEAVGILIDILEPQARYEEAFPLFERVLEINRSLDQQDRAAQALKGMGVIYQRRGEYDRALAMYDEALAVCREQENLSIEAKVLNNIGGIRVQLGNMDDGLKNFKRALDIHNRLGDSAGATVNINNIAVVQFLHGEYRGALKYFEQSLKAADQHGDRKNYALALENISKTLIVIGDYDRGIELSEEALELADKLRYRLIVTTASKNLADANFYKGNTAQAERYYHLAFQAASRSELRTELSLVLLAQARMACYLKQYERCHQHAQAALELAGRTGNAEHQLWATLYLAAVMALGEGREEGLAQLRQSVTRAEHESDPQLVLVARRLLGFILTRPDAPGTERQEGIRLLLLALDLATEKEIAHEVKWLTETLHELDSN